MTDDLCRNITMQQMEALICLVEERSFSRAAMRMLLTQPALTKSIRTVEDSLGVKVVNRSSAGVSLTPEGKILYDIAQRMLKLRKSASDQLQKLSANAGGDIDMGASTIPATYILPRALSELKDRHPDIRIFLKTEDSEEVMNMVLDRDVEIGCIGKEPLNRKLTAYPLWHDRLILVVPPRHRWIKKQPISLSDLLQEPFVLREKGSATRAVFEAAMKEQSISLSQLNIRGELGSSEAIKEAVMAGLGVSVLSVHAVRRELAQRTLFEIDVASLKIERDFFLIHLRQFELRPAHKSFVNFLKNYKAGGLDLL
ncbi:MAG: selenium metabolism-associated LysR family transcriptional regulator [Smithellaceae bacterium]